MTQGAIVPGSTHTYTVHPECKRYTLRDNGFTETKSGKFQLIRPLDYGSDNKKEVQLKIVISKTFDQVKMYTTTGSLQSVNVYKNESLSKEKENLEAILQDLCDKKVLSKVD